jgi:hypothetical protein
MPRITRRALVAVVAPLAVVLGGCGGSSTGTSAKDQINSIVKGEGKNAAVICDHASAALLSKLGGKAACQQKAAGQPADSSVHVTNLTITGTKAVAVIVDKSGTNSVNFVKENGAWLLGG